MTLSQLALTIALLAALGLIAGRFGLSAIPAYLLAGLLLGPHEPHVTSLIEPSEVTTFVAELGIIFLLFFLGLEFTVDRLLRSGRHIGLGGSIDLTVNAAVGLLVGVIAFGFGFPALILAAAIYVSSSAVTVKGAPSRPGAVRRRVGHGFTLGAGSDSLFEGPTGMRRAPTRGRRRLLLGHV